MAPLSPVASWLTSLFPPYDFSLLALLLGMPLLSAAVCGLWGRQLGKQAVRLFALTALGVSFAAALTTFGLLFLQTHHNSDAQAPSFLWTAWTWMYTSKGWGGLEHLPISMAFRVDALNSVMLLVVTGVGFLIHLYSTSYMEEDEGYSRFFAYLNLFVFAMLVLLLADNLPLLFVGWEGVGLCSYLLIGFWYDKTANATAGKKAFLANRIGDFGLLCGMFLLLYYTGALDWNGIAQGATNLLSLRNPVQLWPLGGAHYTGFLAFLQPASPWTISAATAVGLALFLGCAGKSAQIPLYVWLPDAMAGPTPVSALIHAATMVTAGVYLICRLACVFVLSPVVMTLIACIGAATALFAACLALVQHDIKKVLAYSTVSQLGFMFLGVGVGAFVAGFFHVLTHAFFKACLFLGAGSVIHAMHAGLHDDTQAQDMRNMGGLRKHLPITFLTFSAATAAIVGFPFTSGFFSKDEILYKAFVSHATHPFGAKLIARGVQPFEPPPWLGPVLYTVGVLAATLTAFYMTRVLILTFFGEFRGWALPSALSPHVALKAHGEPLHTSPAPLAEYQGRGPLLHESPWPMTLPLVVLAFGSLFAGLLNMAPFHKEPLEHWLAPLFASVKQAIVLHPSAEALELPLALGGVAAFLIGTSLAAWIYGRHQGAPAQRLAASFPRIYRFLCDKGRVDELYEATVLRGMRQLASCTLWLDRVLVDGLLAKGSTWCVQQAGAFFRALQTGIVYVYGAWMLFGMTALGMFFFSPHAEVVRTQQGDQILLEASPGIGYTYRWTVEGQELSHTESIILPLHQDRTQAVRLEVTNVFGKVASQALTVSSHAP